MNLLEELTALVARNTQKDGCRMYRSLYQAPPDAPFLWLRGMDDWRALPQLTREYMSAFSYRERCVAPQSHVERIGVTSGTSGRPPFLSAKGPAHSFDYLGEWHTFTKPVLCVNQNYRRLEDYLVHAGFPVPIIMIDPRAPQMTAALAKASGADAFLVSEPQVRPIAEALAEAGAAPQVRLFSVGGGPISPHVAYLRNKFPSAVLISRYAASEVEGNPIGVACNAVDINDPEQRYHANTDIHLDLIDPDTGADIEPRSGCEGDLTVSLLGRQVVSPLIRYSLGDRVRVAETRCPTHGTWSFVVLGRTDSDFAKVQGGQLRVDEIARVVGLQSLVVGGEFEMHYREQSDTAGLLLHAVLHLEPRAALDWDDLATRIARELRVGPQFTYAQGVERGWYAPLRCVPLPPAQAGKRRRLVRVNN